MNPISNIIVNDTSYEISGNKIHTPVTETEDGLMTVEDKKKLDGIAENANNYTHPTTSGWIHIPSGGSSGQILRWSADGSAAWGNDNNTTYSNATQSANGLMSSEDKKKLDGIANNANNYTYTHPTSSGWKHIPSGGSSGQILRWSADGTAAWGSDNNTTYGTATQSANGLMSASDKKKLDGVATGANNFTYTHPSTHPATMITTDASHRFVTDNEKSSWNSRIPTSNIVNNCTSSNTDKPLSANQGRVLMNGINAINNIKSIPFSYASGFSDCDQNWRTNCWQLGNHLLFLRINFKRNSTIKASQSDLLALQLSLSTSIYGDFGTAGCTDQNNIHCALIMYVDKGLRIDAREDIPANEWVQGNLWILI